MNKYKIVSAKKADNLRIESFLKNNFEITDPQNHSAWLNWQIIRPPASHILLCCTEQNEIAAISFFLPYVFLINNNKHDAAFSISTMVSKDFRRQGLGDSIHNERLKNYSFALSSGQSDANFKLYEKKGFHSLGEYNYALINKTLPKVQLNKIFIHELAAWVKYKLSTALRSPKFELQENVNLPSEIPDTFFNERIGGSSSFPIHNVSYLNWRYLEHPYLSYKINTLYDGDSLVGILITRRDKNTINIIDIYTNISDFQEVLFSFTSQTQYSRIYSLYVGRPIMTEFQMASFYTRTYGSHFIGASLSNELEQKILNNDWCLFWGDSDKDRQ